MRVQFSRDPQTDDDVYTVRIPQDDRQDHRSQYVMDRVLNGIASHVIADWLAAHRAEALAAVTPDVVANALRDALARRLEQALGSPTKPIATSA